ncbi:PP2C family serine/threonine-protein phosphatase [Legionella spiritensis]|uniref:PP2C family serine/threonine-protein phosphatase n=1 Tax=Legionella spiritensis TaxID=452 RepID=UPI000F6F2E1E|nr:PP2C family protein-serine/threonine phosphatase [Legionella spiritensis]VEG91123.1 Protein phosphatase 2C [Legionella spiritensis]
MFDSEKSNRTPERQSILITHPAHKDEGDYRASYPVDDENSAGVCEIKGWRETQEDVLIVETDNLITSFTGLSKEQQTEALLAAFAKMQTYHGQYPMQGSTACVATAWLDEEKCINVVTAGLGDSTAFLIVLDARGELDYSDRLNRLHKATDRAETDYIKRAGGSVSRYRLGGILAISRAIGDTALPGINHTPEIYFRKRKLPDDGVAFLVVACDGLEEGLSRQDIFNYIQENHDVPVEHLAERLAQKAYEAGSRDNISVAVAPVSIKPVSVAVFDGHGGADVSKALGDRFYPVFKKEITLKVKRQDAGIVGQVDEKKNFEMTSFENHYTLFSQSASQSTFLWLIPRSVSNIYDPVYFLNSNNFQCSLQHPQGIYATLNEYEQNENGPVEKNPGFLVEISLPKKRVESCLYDPDTMEILYRNITKIHPDNCAKSLLKQADGEEPESVPIARVNGHFVDETRQDQSDHVCFII